MFDKIKGLGAQVASKATDAAEGIASSVKGGVDSLSNSATLMTDALNEKAVRVSTAQLCTILELAVEEVKARPLSAQPVTLTASVNFGIATLEMQIHMPSADKKNEAEVSRAVGEVVRRV